MSRTHETYNSILQTGREENKIEHSNTIYRSGWFGFGQRLVFSFASSWINYFLGQVHLSRPKRKKKKENEYRIYLISTRALRSTPASLFFWVVVNAFWHDGTNNVKFNLKAVPLETWFISNIKRQTPNSCIWIYAVGSLYLSVVICPYSHHQGQHVLLTRKEVPI